MWVWGLLVFLIFEQLIIRFYLQNIAKTKLQQPMIFYSHWFHPTILVMGLALLSLSCYLFAKTSPWLTLVPVFLTVVAAQRRAWIRSNRRNAVIEQSLRHYYKFKGEGKSEFEANKAVLASMLNDDENRYDDLIRGTDGLLGGEWDIDKVIIILILPQLGLRSDQPDFGNEFKKKLENPNYVMEMDKLEALIDFYKRKLGKKYQTPTPAR